MSNPCTVIWESNMIGVIVISESHASEEMLETVERAIGKGQVRGIIPLVIKSDFTRRSLTEKINRAMRRIGACDGIILMTELYGSTQCNMCTDFLLKGEVELVSGYNLPMLIKAAMLNQTQSLRQLVQVLCTSGKKYIRSFKK